MADEQWRTLIISRCYLINDNDNNDNVRQGRLIVGPIADQSNNLIN